MKEQKYKTDKQSFPHEIKTILQEQLKKTINSFSKQKQINQLILHCIKYREEKGLIYSTSLNGKQYLQESWKHFYQQNVLQRTQVKQKTQQHGPSQDIENQQVYLPQLSLYELILQAATNRQNLIYDEIFNQTLKIQKKIKPLVKINNNEQLKVGQNKQLNESHASKNSQKDFQEFIKNQKLQKERRKKLLQKQLQKQLSIEQQKKQQQQKKKQQQQQKKLQEKRNKEKQLLERRQKQKQLIKKHQSLYSEFQTKLFHLKQSQAQALSFLNRFSTQQLRKIQSERKKVYTSYQKPKIDEHQKTYLQSVNLRKQERYKKFDQMKRIEEIQKEKSRIRYHSSFKFQKPQQEYERMKRQQYERAKQKRDRIMEYRSRVRSNYQPLVDQQKKNQLVRLVEELQSSRKVKRKVLKNGQTVLQKLQVKDSKQIGLNYLQNLKKQVQKMRQHKRQVEQFREDMTQYQNQDLKNNDPSSSRQKPKDYLKQLRQKSKQKQSTSSAFSTPRNTVFSNTRRSSLSFDQKLKRIQTFSNKLIQKTKQQEMLLKYGKFRTPQQILDKKQVIDKNYIELVNMKLKMIEQQFQSQQGNQ